MLNILLQYIRPPPIPEEGADDLITLLYST